MANKVFENMQDMHTTTISGSIPSVKRSWADPANYDHVIGMDYGKQGHAASIYETATRGFERPRIRKDFVDGLLTLPSQYPNSLIVGEQSHFAVPQNETNLAQPFTADVLKTFYKLCEDNHCRFMLFPQLLTPSLKTWAEANRERIAATHKIELSTAKGDIEDAILLMVFTIMENSISLALPYESFVQSDLQEFGNGVRKSANFILNCAAKDNRIYDGNGEYFHAFAKRADDLRKACGINDERKRKYCFSILALMFDDKDHDGTMTPHHYNGRFLRWQDFSQHVLRNTPFHFRGGRARSNIWLHFFRSFVMADFKKLRKDNPEFKKAFKSDKLDSLKRFVEMPESPKQHLVVLKKEFRLLLKVFYNTAKSKWPR